MYTIARRAYSLPNKARTTSILGQDAGSVLSIGGDIIVDAGSGSSNGVVRIGTAARAIAIGSVSKTATVAGGLQANVAAVTGLLTAGSFSNSGVLSTNSLVTSGAVTVGDSAWLVGSVRLGADSLYSLARPARTQANRGFTTYLLGQAAGNVGSNGGDFVIEPGTGGASATAGRLVLGATGQSVEISQSGKTTSVLGHLSVAGSVTTGGSATVAGLTSSAPITATAVRSMGMLTASGITTDQPIIVSGGGVTASGVLSSAGLTTAAGLTSGNIVSGAITSSSVTNSGALTSRTLSASGAASVGSGFVSPGRAGSLRSRHRCAG